ncbi:hypothetical protein [Bacteroides sp. 519]|uniref:hypothetical protein n=1 Tax=Bacteroides sp. 519 TaxID=2302937 RepID=UPI0013D2A89B|nr:hypothetical protein [Bacteroides sp. 519]NDV56565.1 hypothetical protein [Bacteroides sp. 519]
MRIVHYLVIFAFLKINVADIYAHKKCAEHVDDMIAVFGFEENNKLKEWMQFISSDMIDKHEPFYSTLCNNHLGFKCKHRLLFHWAYNARPWSSELEKRIKKYCEEYDLNVESNLRIFKSEIKSEQIKRNRKINEETEKMFGFAHGGRDAAYARFFASIAYNVHLIGDYTSDNTDLDGLQSLNEIISSIIIELRNLDNIKCKNIIRGITQINNCYSDSQKKADALMEYLKKNVPTFIKEAQNGSIKRRLSKHGFILK